MEWNWRETSMEALLVKYGYAVLFLGVAIEGESFLLAASLLAHEGIFNLRTVILLAIGANCFADQIYYMIARARGLSWLQDRFGRHKQYGQVVDWMVRHSNWLLLGSRYAFGFRIIIPAACGALGMQPLRFTVINLIAGIIWAVPMAFLGFYIGNTAEKLLVNARRYEMWLLLLLLIVAVTALLVRHLRRAEWVRDLRLADFHSLVPILIGIMGVINLVSAIWPRSSGHMQAVQSWLPLEVTQRSRALMLFAGVALLQVTRNLARRKELAWHVAVIALSVSLLLHITRALDLHHSLVAGLLLTYLVYFRRRFNARSDPSSIQRGLLLVPILALLMLIYGYVGLKDMQDQFSWYAGSNPLNQAFRCGILILEPNLNPKTVHAARFLGSLQIAGWLARLYVLVLLLRPVILRRRMEASPEVTGYIFRTHSRRSLSAFAIQRDKHHLLVAGGKALVAYAARGSVALACGDPLAAEEDFEESVREYMAYCRRNGWTPCIYEAAEVQLPIYHKLGLRSLKLAEEAVIDLREFSLAGNKRAGLRAMVNKAAKTGMCVQRYDSSAKHHPVIDEQLESISSEWLAEKRLPEMGFTLGRFSLEAIEQIPFFIVIMDDAVKAFCSWLPYRNGRAAVLDLMRKRKDAVAGTMDYLLAESLLQLKAAGLDEASLSNAPLANVGDPHGTLDRGVALIFEKMNSFYGYKNLFQFKKKFYPRWEGRFLVYPAGTDLPRVAYALTGVHNSGGLLQLFLRR
jgi:phosphatidylglycerol lysyltransferase